MKAAGAAVGVTAQALSDALRHSPLAIAYAEQLQSAIHTKVVDLSAVIERMSAKAVARIGMLIDTASKEDVQLRAAQDILDRNPATSKTRRVAIESLSLTGKDVMALTQAIVSGAGLREEFDAAAVGDYTPGIETVND
jgi:hypothetical protein